MLRDCASLVVSTYSNEGCGCRRGERGGDGWDGVLGLTYWGRWKLRPEDGFNSIRLRFCFLSEERPGRHDKDQRQQRAVLYSYVI